MKEDIFVGEGGRYYKIDKNELKDNMSNEEIYEMVENNKIKYTVLEPDNKSILIWKEYEKEICMDLSSFTSEYYKMLNISRNGFF